MRFSDHPITIESSYYKSGQVPELNEPKYQPLSLFAHRFLRVQEPIQLSEEGAEIPQRKEYPQAHNNYEFCLDVKLIFGISDLEDHDDKD